LITNYYKLLVAFQTGAQLAGLVTAAPAKVLATVETLALTGHEQKGKQTNRDQYEDIHYYF
jgi:hypothetical protein